MLTDHLLLWSIHVLLCAGSAKLQVNIIIHRFFIGCTWLAHGLPLLTNRAGWSAGVPFGRSWQPADSGAPHVVRAATGLATGPGKAVRGDPGHVAGQRRRGANPRSGHTSGPHQPLAGLCRRRHLFLLSRRRCCPCWLALFTRCSPHLHHRMHETRGPALCQHTTSGRDRRKWSEVVRILGYMIRPCVTK